ncbi:methylated-DNA--[protein]-cysteine S-methyltransferase [Lactiplantibacillus daowaiensis]|uniref:Methylated-DNA--[protein]-cysteine S-methyltransferase n=1 Tax=Lactiplantibacillus daowaiensis TaxID=2559918 RepID=A0ABW1RXL3_9LACO|nr:methylated-DNA--[protein]-cysteine S-methyltransferase [Lactiplantibacillus daowaiensis]
MKLTLTQLQFEQHTYWLGSTTAGLAFVGSRDGDADEWHQFYPTATATIDSTGNHTAKQAVQAYLTGHSDAFDTLALDLTHGTSFQQAVWHALQAIPYGQTWTYSDLATALNRPQAVRAIASAVGRNPLLIVVPCHRVVRKDGTLGGYRGGLAMKRGLLRLEQTHEN